MATQFPDGTPNAGAARQRMQRVRVGLTGLAAVLLIIALATAIASSVRRHATAEQSGSQMRSLEASKTDPDNAIDPHAEPLAQLGVAPGATGDSKDVAGAPQKRPN